MARDAEEFRGHQVTIGKMVFVLPADVPVTDPEVVEREELIATIENAIAPHRAAVRFADDVVKLLREDITRCFRQRATEEGEQMRLFAISDQAPASDTDMKRKMVRNSLWNFGWENRINELATTGADDDVLAMFIRNELPAIEDKRRFGEVLLKVVGGESPSITYVSDDTDEPRDRVRLAGKDLARVFRQAFAIGVGARASAKKKSA